MKPEVRSKQEMSLALYEQAELARFQALPRDPCEEGHVWGLYSSGEAECENCGLLVELRLD